MKNQVLFILYEQVQVGELERLFHEQPELRENSSVVALALDIENKLVERNIPFYSGRTYKKIPSDILTTEDTMMEMFFADARWKEFSYRGVYLPTTFKFMFRVYLQRVRYYGNILISMIEAHSEITEFKLFAPSAVISKTFGILAHREVNVVLDCAKKVAETRSMDVEILPLSGTRAMRNRFIPAIFMIRRSLFGFLLSIWNRIVTILKRPEHPRMIISDHWRNVGSSIGLLKKGECIFLDRTEIRHIGWRTILHYRMRFLHIEDFLSSTMRVSVNEHSYTFSQVWNNMRKDILPLFSWRGYSFDSLLLNAIDDIAGNFERILGEIEGTFALYKKLQPDIVLLRASVSAQTHFSILPLVAQQCGIPSLELQHGIEYLGPGSWSREHTAEYLAVYGPLVKKELISLGYAPEKIREIGSPRFDHHRNAIKKGSKKDTFTVLCIAPDVRPFEIYDSHSTEDYFHAIAHAIGTLQDVHVIIKLRPGPADEVLFRSIIGRVFSGIPHTVAQYESLFDLYAKSSVVISCFSTSILEALQSGIPVIIPASNPVDEQVICFHFSHYSNAGILSIVSKKEEFAQLLSDIALHPEKRLDLQVKIGEFIKNNFCFDGNSSARYAHLIIELVRQSKNRHP